MRAPEVFISYSHERDTIPDHRRRAAKLALELNRRGIPTTIDQYFETKPPHWPTWMIHQIARVDFVLCLASPSYKERIDSLNGEDWGDHNEAGGLGTVWEGLYISDQLYEAMTVGGHDKFVNVVLPDCSASEIPTLLRPTTTTHYRIPRDQEDLYRRLTDQPRPDAVKPPVGPLIRLDQEEFVTFDLD